MQTKHQTRHDSHILLSCSGKLQQHSSFYKIWQTFAFTLWVYNKVKLAWHAEIISLFGGKKCHVNNLQAYLQRQVQFPVLDTLLPICQVLYGGMLEWNYTPSLDCAMHVAAVEWCGNLKNFETLMSLGPVNVHSNITINTRWESKILYTTLHKIKGYFKHHLQNCTRMCP